MAEKETTGVKSALRVLDLLELLSTTAGAYKLSDIARRLAMPKSSTSALLGTLMSRGYVDSDANGYRLADRYRRTGWVGGPYARLLGAARPVMAGLSAAIRESVFIGVLNERNMVQYLDKVVSAEPLRYDADLNKERYAYATTIGQVILSGWPSDRVERYLAAAPLTQVTPKTEIDLARLLEQISHVREAGYGELTDTHQLGGAGIGAPIRDESNQVVAGLCTFGPTPRMSASWDAHRAAVLRAAQEITQTLQSE